MKVKNIILSWDFVISVIIAIITWCLLPLWLKLPFAAGFYMVGITVLSIVFSLFFAALAIIMSSTDNDFILYLEEKKQFTTLMTSFRFTLYVLFLSLVYSIILYTCSDYVIKELGEKTVQHKVFFIIFLFLFSYSLLATGLSVKDSISFTHYRTKFLGGLKKKESQDTTDGKAST
jgi:hypothetical protein